MSAPFKVVGLTFYCLSRQEGLQLCLAKANIQDCYSYELDPGNIYHHSALLGNMLWRKSKLSLIHVNL